MATITKGILGGFSGKVGTVVGSRWRGKDYIRSIPTPSSKEPSEAQMDQQEKFRLMVQFLQPIMGLINVGFGHYGSNMSGFNSAMSYNLKNAIGSMNPGFEILYPNVLISRGDLPNAVNPGATSTTPGQVSFNWSNNAGMGKAKAGDKAILLVYCPIQKQAFYTIGTSTRVNAGEIVNVQAFSGDSVETYIAFISEDGRDVATSIFTGELLVS